MAADLNTPIPAGAPAGRQPGDPRPPDQRARTRARLEPGHDAVCRDARGPRPLPDLRPPDIAAGSDIVSSRRDLSGVELGSGFTGDFQPVTVQVSDAAAELHLGAQHADHAEGDDRRSATPPNRSAGWCSPRTRSRRRRSPTPGSAPPRPGSPSRSAPVRTTRCSSCAITRPGRAARRPRRAGHDRRADPQRDRRRPAHPHRGRRERRHPTHTERGIGRCTGAAGRDPRHRHGLPGADRLALAPRQLPRTNRPTPTWRSSIFGLPALAAAGAWLLGRTPTAISRRSLE